MNPSQALQALLSSFPRHDASDPALAATAYVFSIEGIQPQAVVDAVKRFIQGRVEGQNPRFCPTPAELAREARRIDAALTWEATKALAPPSKPMEIEFTPEQRAENGLRIQALADRMAGRETTGDSIPYRLEVDRRMDAPVTQSQWKELQG